MRELLRLRLHHDSDVVSARRRTAELAERLGLAPLEQTRIATAVCEIARSVCRYGRAGAVAFAVDEASRPQRFVTLVTDRGPGIAHLERVLAGDDGSSIGPGMGIAGARRLVSRMTIRKSPEGAEVLLEMDLPTRAPLATRERLDQIAAAVAARGPASLGEEVQAQNQALLRAFDELGRRQEELQRVNRELEDTNRGVVALYAELDERADALRRAGEVQARLFSNITHEFRTPVYAILGLCDLLLEDRLRAGQVAEPELRFIRQAADQLAGLVNDLLDMARVDGGKTTIRPGPLDVDHLFGALRGMLRPLLVSPSVTLVFDDAGGLPEMYTDESKLSQVLRNLISNALKFTARGEVRVSAAADAAAGTIVFTVADTGIGIAAADQQRIFDEFTQVEPPLQHGVPGTGLGLALSRRLTELLGGRLTVQSAPGAGSTFRLSLPLRYSGPAD